jgi:hypothetical protein
MNPKTSEQTPLKVSALKQLGNCKPANSEADSWKKKRANYVAQLFLQIKFSSVMSCRQNKVNALITGNRGNLFLMFSPGSTG